MCKSITFSRIKLFISFNIVLPWESIWIASSEQWEQKQFRERFIVSEDYSKMNIFCLMNIRSGTWRRCQFRTWLSTSASEDRDWRRKTSVAKDDPHLCTLRARRVSLTEVSKWTKEKTQIYTFLLHSSTHWTTDLSIRYQMFNLLGRIRINHSILHLLSIYRHMIDNILIFS